MNVQLKKESYPKSKAMIVAGKDGLLEAKIYQCYYASTFHHLILKFHMLSVTGSCCQPCTDGGNIKIETRRELLSSFPRFDGPYEIINVHTATSNYTLELPNSPNTFPTYHASELKLHIANNPLLFPSRELPEPKPILTAEGYEEYLVDSIIDSRRRGRGYQCSGSAMGWLRT